MTEINREKMDQQEIYENNGVIRRDINADYAYSGFVEAGDFIFLSFCVGNIGESVEKQIDGALDQMSNRLREVNLTLDSVVKVEILLRDIWDIPIMEEVFKRRFNGNFPARKTISTEFAHVGGPDGLKVQIDGIAYNPKVY
ncbi:RidA family protein [Vallitalea okinawensis]|uniref:RidA family protein n=1 Tax=Vallitalea okinawensis TaxID=2078660 RepID=UPI001FA8B5AD|nr:RidA family protein [Vallitalea okinawensis]